MFTVHLLVTLWLGGARSLPRGSAFYITDDSGQTHMPSSHISVSWATVGGRTTKRGKGKHRLNRLGYWRRAAAHPEDCVCATEAQSLTPRGSHPIAVETPGIRGEGKEAMK